MQPCSATWLPGNHPELRSYSTSHPGAITPDARSVPRLTTLSRLHRSPDSSLATSSSPLSRSKHNVCKHAVSPLPTQRGSRYLPLRSSRHSLGAINLRASSSVLLSCSQATMTLSVTQTFWRRSLFLRHSSAHSACSGTSKCLATTLTLVVPTLILQQKRFLITRCQHFSLIPDFLHLASMFLHPKSLMHSN